MNLKNYITSGILEGYILEMLSDQEKSDVEIKMKTYTQLKKERDTIEAGLFNYLKAFKIRIPEESKEKILNRIETQINKSSNKNIKRPSF